MEMSPWEMHTDFNAWAERSETIYTRIISDASERHRAYLQIRELDGSWYWSAATYVQHQPKLCQYFNGKLDSARYSIRDAERRVTRVAFRVLTKARQRSRLPL
jgi:hypothetical protein